MNVHKWRVFLCVVVVCHLFLVVSVFGADNHLQTSAARRAAIEQSRIEHIQTVNAFKQGNHVSALELIEKKVRKSSKAPNQELQRARLLSAVAADLSNQREYRKCREVAAIALSKVHTQKRVTMNANDQGSALRLAAQIYDKILQDSSMAIPIYREVLARNPQDKAIANRLAFLEARDATIVAKMRATAEARKR